ncbi:MAG: helix-turn-helix transcriptional regulator [Treponema sp.]|nr:helix-turn-helix transcriptional regulator [Treponema sp.]
MNIDQIGGLLKEYRERYNVSQEDLCGDFCAVSTLARIESGEELPGQDLIRYFFNRLGISAPATSIEEQNISVTRYMIDCRIMEKYERGDFDYMDLLEDYVHCAEAGVLEYQYYDFLNAVHIRHETGVSEQTLALLEKAIQYTMPSYKRDTVPTRKLISEMESLIFYEITTDLYTLGFKESALRLSEYLALYISRERMSEYTAQYVEPMLWQNIAQWRLEAGNAKSALEAAEKGIDACVWRSALRSFPKLVRTKGNALIQLGRTDEGNKCIAHAQAIDAVIAMHSPFTTSSSTSR